jgi:hypothetical protein
MENLYILSGLGADEVFKEVWSTFNYPKKILLGNSTSFERLDASMAAF